MITTPVLDTVFDYALFTVHMYVPDPKDRALLGSEYSLPKLCYEMRGRAGKYYNLVTDECTAVSAHYINVSKYANVIDEISIRAVDDTKSACTNIRIAVSRCTTFVNDNPLTQLNYSMNGISIRRMVNNATGQGHVLVSVPNCYNLRLVMRIDCQIKILSNFDGTTFIARMIRFQVERGLNCGHRDAHGLLGTVLMEA